MKHFIQNLYLLLITTYIVQSKILNATKGACSISTISIPVGSSSPVMVYNARINEEDWQLTVLDKDQISKYKVDGNLFYSDKKSGESWFVNKFVDDKQFESMRDAFSQCRTLNTDSKESKDFDNNIYEKLRTSTLPSNVCLRVNTEKTTSFLQVGTKSFLAEDSSFEDMALTAPETNSDSTSDSYKEITEQESEDMKVDMSAEENDMDKDIEELEKEDDVDLEEEKAQSLNNDAYLANNELQEELSQDNNENHPSNDIIMD
jgi:hypothetical protein